MVNTSKLFQTICLILFSNIYGLAGCTLLSAASFEAQQGVWPNKKSIYNFHHILPEESYVTLNDHGRRLDSLFHSNNNNILHGNIHKSGANVQVTNKLRKESLNYKKNRRKKHSKFPGKKGIGMTLRPAGQKGSWEQNLPLVVALQPYWNYCWSSRRIDQQPENIEFVPMIWGVWGLQGLQETMNQTIIPMYNAGQYKRLLGFNEPDSALQANMDVSSAVAYWKYLEVPGMPLASPAVATIQGQWMSQFVHEVESQGLWMDYIAVHWYGNANADSFKSEMWSIYQSYGGKWPLLITEFAPADWSAKSVETNRFSQATVLTFMKAVLPWLEAQDWIYGYAWFSFLPDFPAGTSSALFHTDGTMTVLGEYYASVRTESPNGDQSIVA